MTEPFDNEIDFMSAIIRIGASLIAAILLVSLFVPVHAENVTGNITGNFTDNTTVIAPINQSFIPYLYQGDTAYVGTYVDISGVAPPYPSLAYWDGFDMYNSVPSYNYTLPDSKKGYYLFYIDPEIFANRTGWWYKYNGEFAGRVMFMCTSAAGSSVTGDRISFFGPAGDPARPAAIRRTPRRDCRA